MPRQISRPSAEYLEIDACYLVSCEIIIEIIYWMFEYSLGRELNISNVPVFNYPQVFELTEQD